MSVLTQLLSQSFSEKKIDQIDRRLDEIVGLLQKLPLNTEQTSHASLQSPGGSQGTLLADTGVEASSVMEGESSLAAQFTFADNFMRKVAGGNSLSSNSPGEELQENLKVLSRIVSSYKQHPFTDEIVYPHARLVKRPSFYGCELPPIQETVKVIRVAECGFLPRDVLHPLINRDSQLLQQLNVSLEQAGYTDISQCTSFQKPA